MIPYHARLFTITIMFLLSSCLARPTESNTPSPENLTIDIHPFTELAQKATCADVKNQLYIIDDQFVFWTLIGNCDDAGYAHRLYSTTPQEKLCSLADTIAGPQESCQPEFDDVFQTILQNLERPDLGLGKTHEVVIIDLLTP